MPCRHAQLSEEAYEISTVTGEWQPGTGPMLCSWAQDSAPDQLMNVPRWMQRNALAGHLLNYPDDCLGCPCFDAKTE